MDGIILLYYKYVSIQYPQQVVNWIRSLCSRLSLKGRIFVATEGINGTVGGTTENIATFKKEFLGHPLFHGTDLKESPGIADYFPRLIVKVKNEIVALGIAPEQLTVKNTGIHLSPEAAHEMIQTKKDLVILDARNDYESRIGRFKNALIPPLASFRDFPAYIESNIEKFKDKEVLMYCTGGVRCERATAFLQEKQVAKAIYQIDGGICRYVEKFPNGFFRGKNYVFDDRIALKVTDDILSTCDVCSIAADTYTNCMNALCNKQFIACSTCRESFDHTCSSNCYKKVASGAVKTRTSRVGIY